MRARRRPSPAALRLRLGERFGLSTEPQEAIMSAAEQIHEANANFTAAVRAGDAAAMTAIYTEDAQVLPPNGEVVRGGEAIAAFWQSVLDQGVRDARPASVEVLSMGDLAVEVGTYSIHNEDGDVLDRGKIMVVWKEEEGVWKMYRDIWNSSLPLPDEGA